MPLVTIAVTIILFCWLLLYFIGSWFAYRQKLEQADVIICLSGTGGKIETFHERIDTAIELYKKGWSKSIIMSGMFSRQVGDQNKTPLTPEQIEQLVNQGRVENVENDLRKGGADLSLGAHYMKKHAIKKGVPEENIITENQAIRTKENALFSIEIMKNHGWKKAIVVTSPFHQRRAFEEFKKYGTDQKIEMRSYAAKSRAWKRPVWFLSRENVRQVIEELKKLFEYGLLKK